jgi:hypothetical protein
MGTSCPRTSSASFLSVRSLDHCDGRVTCPVQDIAGHKLSDSVLERLPTLTTISAGGRISYSEVVAFYTVVKGEWCFSRLFG